MSVNSSWFSIANESAPAAEGVSVPSAGSPIPGSSSSAETGGSQLRASVPDSAQDEVKVQLEPPGEIAVYQFVNQQGSLILQVPPQVMINLAQGIAQQLAQEATPGEDAGGKGGNPDGH
jgi:hypothetical protein